MVRFRVSALAALFVFFLGVSFVAGEEIKGKITKIDDKGVTVLVKKSPDKDGKAYGFAKGCKFFTKAKDAEKEVIKEGVKAAVFQTLPTKGLSAIITTNNENLVTEIIVTAKKKAAN